MLTSATRTAHRGHPGGLLALHHMRRGYRKKKLPKSPNAPNAPNILSQCHTTLGHYGRRLRCSPSSLTRFNLRSAFGCFADHRRQPRSIAPGSEYFFCRGMMPGHPGRALHVIANATIQPPSLASSGDWPGRAMVVTVSAIDQYRSCGVSRERIV